MENQKKKKETVVYPTLSPFRNLVNYKTMHAEHAKSIGKYEEFMEAKTLTDARKIAFK